MAVPKRKTTPSKRGMRQSHDSLTTILPSRCPECGEEKLSHHACPSCGFYNGHYILKIKNKNKTKTANQTSSKPYEKIK